jgi:tetratricopeptide (TPR) repeat protein/transglutaminase-like putative cysteine protease
MNARSSRRRRPFWAALFPVALYLVCLSPPRLASQASQPPPSTVSTVPAAEQKKAPPDYSKEAFVVEKYNTLILFENDGTSRQENTIRARVQSDAAVQQIGELRFGYNSANEKLEIDYVRVLKPNGGIIEAGASAVQDLTAPISREAPMYTDFRLKHVSVRALQPGDTLEYKTTKWVTDPLAPGQFWYEYNFERDVIVLEEQLTLLVPQGRDIKLQIRRVDPAQTKEVTLPGGRRYLQYQWLHKNLARPTEEEEKERRKKLAEEDERRPDLQLSTFRTWQEVSRWYAALEKERIAATPEIRAKARELTRNRASPAEKAEALYDFVAKNFRYVSLSFGVGRVQPHAASDVFSNRYGDCKDKHTLLAAMLDSVGMKARAVLIHSQRKLDPALPSPSQFDHVITLVEAGELRLWMDTTTEVAPFRLLSANLRAKQALVVTPDGGRLEETPADPPFLTTQDVQVTGSINELGALEANVKYELRGDAELQLRMAFRRTPQADWKRLANWIAMSDGFRGDVTKVNASDPADTVLPFRFDFTIRRTGYFDWSSKRSQIGLPLPKVGLPSAGEGEDEGQKKLEFGSPADVKTSLVLTLAPGLSTRAPVAISVKRDYAEYVSSYTVSDGKLTATRTLRFRERELPVERRSDYLAFQRAVRNDEEQDLWVDNATPGAPSIPADAKAEEIYNTANNALQNSNYEVAIELYKRVVQLEPKHKYAWNNLGRSYLALRRFEEAIAAFRKQIEVNPFDEYAHNNLGRAFWLQQKYDEAEVAFRKQIEINPLDRWAHANLAHMLRERRRYADAIPEYEKAIGITPQDATLHVGLGQALLQTDKPEEALAAFDKAVELMPAPPVWNNIAYELSLKKVHLERAQQYAESAVAATAAALRNISLERIAMRDMAQVSSIAAYWDTLGWVYFQRGDLARAEKYVRAAWVLAQHGEVGDHLGQILERTGSKSEAMATYAQSLSAVRPVPETWPRVVALAGGEKQADDLKSKHADELFKMRTVPLGNVSSESGTADFLVVLNGLGQAEEVKFLRGEEKLRTLAEALRSAKFPAVAPDDTPIRMPRRGMLTCSATTKECVFMLTLPDDVTSVN